MNTQDPALFRQQCHARGAWVDADGGRGEVVYATSFIERFTETWT